jgi:hypothetical protein
MGWKWVALVFFLLGIFCLPVWPYSSNWHIYPTVFCWFIAALTLLVSIFAKRGSTIWKHKGQG